MRRRDFTTALLGGAATLGLWPFASRAQQGAIPVIGFLRITSAADSAHLATAFRQGLRESGFIEGQNVAIEYRYAENHRDRVPGLVGELIGRQVAVIATDQAAREAKAATSAIPILFILGADPVAGGLVASLNRPGANVTGIVFLSSQLGAKRIELLRQLVSTASSHFRSAPKTRPSEVRLKRQRGPRVSKSSSPMRFEKARSTMHSRRSPKSALVPCSWALVPSFVPIRNESD
jgi:putative tryptophan/tyrosine transport system substrate-binding protein